MAAEPPSSTDPASASAVCCQRRWRERQAQSKRHRRRGSNWGKSPGTQVQHTLEARTKGTGFRHFLASDYGTVRAVTKFARTFAPLTRTAIHLNKLKY